MTFYNPNIQDFFEADKRNYVFLQGVQLASYAINFRVSEGCSVKSVNDVRAPYQFEFLSFENDFQFKNLQLIKPDFPQILAEITLEVLAGRVRTFEDYLLLQLSFAGEAHRNEVLYIGDYLQDFIELLIYSDIVDDKLSSGERDYTKILGVVDRIDNKPVYYNLYERLKLFARLRKEIILDIDKESISLNERTISLVLTLKV